MGLVAKIFTQRLSEPGTWFVLYADANTQLAGIPERGPSFMYLPYQVSSLPVSKYMFSLIFKMYWLSLASA